MNAYKEAYQPPVIANAKAFVRAPHEARLDVRGDPSVDFAALA